MICRHCNSEFEMQEGMKFCPHCGQPVEEPAPERTSLPEENESTDEFKKAPWEDRNYSYLEGFWMTFREAVFNPVEFFHNLQPKGDLFMPLLYAIIFVLISQLAGIFYLKIFGMPFMSFFQKMMEAQGQAFDPEMFNNMVMGQAYAQLLMIPLLYVVFFFIGAGINHVLLLLFGAGKNGYISTFKVMSYAYGASIFNLIPFIGGLISSIWWAVLSVIGFKEIHKTSYGKVILATVVIPLFLCALCCVISVVSILGLFSANSGLRY